MTVQTAAGAKLYLGPVAAASVNTLGAFQALVYTEVGEIESLGEFGDQATEITFTSLGDRRVRKFKGSFNAGTLALTLGRDPSDSGQAALVAAAAQDDDYAVKITLNDEGNGSPQNPTTFYFRGKVMGYTANIGNAENVVRSTVNIGINSAIIEQATV